MHFTTLISTVDLARGIDDPDLAIVDCRHDLADVGAGERAYLAGHLPRAQFMHIDRDLSGPKTGANGRHPLPEVSAFVATLDRAGIGNSTQVVAYDQNNGMWASRLWWLLRWLGHEGVAVLDGGMDKWMRESRAVTRDLLRVRPAIFVPQPSAPVASTIEILASLNARSLKVIDARASERFRGDVEPIDPVAGHIPGAINRPYSANLSSEGTFKPEARLYQEFSALLDGATPASVVHQCGSGVTACHNVLAMTVAGLPGSRLYPGSWSE
jgi:thiosulfate/3-mercaptopyruvate sulfurtransferase